MDFPRNCFCPMPTASHKSSTNFDPQPPSLSYVSFNHDCSCFSVGTSEGFRIYNCDPLREIYRQDFAEGGIGVAEMILQEGRNMTALVKVGLTDILIWDVRMKCPSVQVPFRLKAAKPDVVKAVKQGCNLLLVVLEHEICELSFPRLNIDHQIQTITNPKGLCAVSQSAGGTVMACPVYSTGQIRIERYPSLHSTDIQAYVSSTVYCLALSADGQLVATSSINRNSVRIFDTVNGYLLREVRLPEDEVGIYSLAFSTNAQRLAVSGDKGTVHVFGLNKSFSGSGSGKICDIKHADDISYSFLLYTKGVLHMKPSLEYFAHFRLHNGVRNIVAFGRQINTVNIVGLDGSFYRCEFDPVNGGETIELEHHNFLKLKYD